jgi:hypothetical protein
MSATTVFSRTSAKNNLLQDDRYIAKQSSNRRALQALGYTLSSCSVPATAFTYTPPANVTSASNPNSSSIAKLNAQKMDRYTATQTSNRNALQALANTIGGCPGPIRNYTTPIVPCANQSLFV